MLSSQIAQFLAKKRRKSPATHDQYRFVLERILLPWCESEGLSAADQITDRAMDRFTEFLEARQKNGKPLAIATIRTYIKATGIFLKWAKVDRGDYEPPSEPRRLRDTLSRQEIDVLERTATDERDRLIVRVLADTGMRVSELLGLRLADLRADSHAKKYFLRVIGKGNKEREVGVPEATFKRLHHFAKHNDREFIFYGKRARSNGLVERLTRNGIDQLIRNLARRAGIGRRVWPHLFRFSYITHMARKGVPVQDVMKAVGHKTPAMTMVIYNQTTADDLYDVLQAALRSY